MRDGAARMADDRLFHARAAVTMNVRSAKVDRRTSGSIRVVVVNEQR